MAKNLLDSICMTPSDAYKLVAAVLVGAALIWNNKAETEKLRISHEHDIRLIRAEREADAAKLAEDWATQKLKDASQSDLISKNCETIQVVKDEVRDVEGDVREANYKYETILRGQDEMKTSINNIDAYVRRMELEENTLIKRVQNEFKNEEK